MAIPEVVTVERPDQLKALGHPLRLRVLETLAASDEPLTNRELALKVGVDPGHLHFHVKMLLSAGLIERANGGQRREKPYRAVGRRVRVAPELLAHGSANDVRAAMLEEVQRAWSRFSPTSEFRSAQMLVTIDPDKVRELWDALVEKARELEDESFPAQMVTLFTHPSLSDPG
jgi:DNA-binding transcriptional ArsR family regulator